MLIKRGSWAKSYRLGLGVGDGDELSHDGDESGFFAERSALGACWREPMLSRSLRASARDQPY